MHTLTVLSGHLSPPSNGRFVKPYKSVAVKAFPDEFGKFGRFGGRFVPEVLVSALTELESAFRSLAANQEFQRKLSLILRDYAGRETPLYFAENLSNKYKRSDGKGPKIYLKREDLSHTGSHKINNVVGQVLLAQTLGKKRIIAETASGQHGIATAALCARLGMDCVVYMGAQDFKRDPLSITKMHLLGAEVRAVHSGTATLKDAVSEAIRDVVSDLDSTHYVIGSIIGPHPYPLMVREFHAVIGRETRRQAMEKWGGKPDVLVACVGRGSSAIGLFHEFDQDENVRLIGVEAAGQGLDSGCHSAALVKGEVGVLHGAMSYLLQDDYAFERLARLEGIVPGLETSHALAYLELLCPELPDGARVVVNCNSKGTKDLQAVARHMKYTNLI